jgi:hypothetical protein
LAATIALLNPDLGRTVRPTLIFKRGSARLRKHGDPETIERQEVSLDRRTLFAVVTGFLALSTQALGFENPAFEDYRISSPVVRDNLAVYFIHGNGASAAAPLTLDQALAAGAVKIYESPQHPIAIENLSGQSVFVQLGTLLKGGLQDQVVAQSMILPPGSGRVPLDIFCIDPFRSTTRGDEDPTAFSTSGALFPWRMARLAMLAGSADSKAVQLLRQSGIWWSIDTARSQLSAIIGEPLEPPQAASWQTPDIRDARPQVLLREQQSPWTTSLPLALENRRLAQMQQPYLDGFSGESIGDDVIGAVFAVNGRIEGAEIYQSHELFGRIWPNLLRAYATQAIAANDATAETLPPVAAVKASLAAAQEGRARQRTADSQVLVRENEAAIYSEITARDGDWIYRSYVPKLAPAGSPVTPDALVVDILQSGQVDGRPLASLDDKQVVVLQSASPDPWSAAQWSAAVAPSLEVARDLDPALWPHLERVRTDRVAWLLSEQLRSREWEGAKNREPSGTFGIFLLAAFGVWLFPVLLRRSAAARRCIRRRALNRAEAQAMVGQLGSAAPPADHRRRLSLIAVAAVAVAGVLAMSLRLSFQAAAAFVRLQRALCDRLLRRMNRRPARPGIRSACAVPLSPHLRARDAGQRHHAWAPAPA